MLVAPAQVSDREAGRQLLDRYGHRFPCIERLWVDGNDRGGFDGLVTATYGWTVEVVGVRQSPSGERRPPAHRWVVERSFAWLGRFRRLSKDDEELPEVEEAWIYLAMVRIMLRRLTRLDL